MITTLLLLVFTTSVVIGKEQSSTMFSSNIDVSDNCKTAVQRLTALQATQPQLLAHYWDSWGKPSDSILTGHTTFLGYYDECINLKNTELGDMSYCLYAMAMDMNIIQSTSESPDGVCHTSDCPTQVNTSTMFNVRVGVCYPSACSASEFALVLSKMNITNIISMTTDPFSGTTNSVNIKVHSVSDSPAFCPVTDVEYDTGAVAVIVVCVVLVGLVVLGTTLDVVLWQFSSPKVAPDVVEESEKLLPGKDNSQETQGTLKSAVVPDMKTKTEQPTVKELLLAFSLYNTIPSLLMRQRPSALKALGAMKIFSNFAIVTLHLFYIIGVFFSGTSHNSYLLDLMKRIELQPMINVTFAVECFFVVSATLSSYLTLKDMEKFKKFRFVYFYLNRFFRLSPMFYLFTLIAYKLSARFGQGPLWFSLDAETCVNSWWYNVLYITNIKKILDICILVTWHVAVEMQLFLFSPIFIVLLYRSELVGLIAVGAAMIGATAAVGYAAATNGYWVAILYNPDILQQISYLHCQTFYRINSYLTGIVLGYILYKKYNLANLPIAKWLKQSMYMLLWMVAIVLCTVTVLAPYFEYSFAYHYSNFENTVILMFSGLAWSIGIAIIIYICNTGYGGMVNSFLSWPGWEPLVKLTYGVALCHEMVIFFIVGTLQSGLKYTDTVFAMLLVFTMVLSYSISVATAICVELPISKVVSLCFRLAGIEARSK